MYATTLPWCMSGSRNVYRATCQVGWLSKYESERELTYMGQPEQSAICCVNGAHIYTSAALL